MPGDGTHRGDVSFSSASFYALDPPRRHPPGFGPVPRYRLMRFTDVSDGAQEYILVDGSLLGRTPDGVSSSQSPASELDTFDHAAGVTDQKSQRVIATLISDNAALHNMLIQARHLLHVYERDIGSLTEQNRSLLETVRCWTSAFTQQAIDVQRKADLLAKETGALGRVDESTTWVDLSYSDYRVDHSTVLGRVSLA